MFYVNDCIFQAILLHVTYLTKNPIMWECLEQLLILFEMESKKLIKRNSRHSFKTEQFFLGNFLEHDHLKCKNCVPSKMIKIKFLHILQIAL